MIVTTKYLSSEGIPNFFNRKGCVFVIGSKEQLQASLQSTMEKLVASNLNYEVRFHNVRGINSLADYIGGDTICPLFNVFGQIRGYIVSDSSEYNLSDTVETVVKEVIRNQTEYHKDILIAAAFNSPVEFNNSIDSIYGEQRNIDGKTDCRSNFLPFDISSIPLAALGAVALNFDSDFDLDTSVGLDDVSLNENLDFSNTTTGKWRYLNSSNMSSKNKREFLKHIPEKVSERYIKKNPNCKKDLEALIASVSHEDLQELVLELITRQKGATQIFDFSNLSAASEYEIHVKKWDNTLNGFDYKYHYCIFLKDLKNKEYPIRFQHHPAYCIYLMYLIDRVNRKDDATYLSIKDNREQFIRLYQKVFGDPYEVAVKKYQSFAYRLNKEGEPTRKGRYDDYLKDIDNTIVALVGRIDSIPLKLRDGGHLEILPDRIKIDKELLAFNFK